MRPISAEVSRGYSHLTSGTSKGSFTPLLQLKKFPDIPVSTREEARASRPHPEEPRFHLIAPEEGSFPCVVGKEFTAYLKRRRSPQERREKLQCRDIIPRVPQIAQCAGVQARCIQGIRRMDGVDVESLVYLLM